jgi:hypothetical protein
MPVKISLCVITKNEEKHIGECLESAHPWVDEIIVVDTGSSDSTTQIAQQHGATVDMIKWTDDFSAARNASIDHATGDWILWMDADEIMPSETGMKLRMLASYADKKVAGFLFSVIVPSTISGDVSERIEHIKLFRNLPQLRFTGRVHEQIYPQIIAAGYTVIPTTYTILHTHYDVTLEGQSKRDRYYQKIMQQEVIDRPQDAFAQFNLGMVESRLGNHVAVIKALETYHEFAPARTTVTHKAFSVLIFSYQHLQKWEELERTVINAQQVLPHNLEILYAAGRAYYEKGDFETALLLFEELGESSFAEYPSGFDPQNLHIWTPYYLTILYIKKGDEKRATDWRTVVANRDPRLLDTIETIVNNKNIDPTK